MTEKSFSLFTYYVLTSGAEKSLVLYIIKYFYIFPTCNSYLILCALRQVILPRHFLFFIAVLCVSFMSK